VSTLFAVEVRRLLARRIVRFVAALAVFGMLLAGLVLFVRSHPSDSSARAQAAAQAQAEARRLVAECIQNTSPTAVPAGLSVQDYCKQVTFVPYVPDPAFHLTHYREVAEGLSGLFIAILVVLGATSAGAEWHAGTVTTQLTWEPRRGPMLLAKITSAALVAFVGFWLAEALLFGALWPAAAFRGTTQGIDTEWFRGTAAILLRASAVAAMGAAIGHSLAWLARNTAVAVGAILGYAAVVEPLLRVIRPKWERWFPVGNAIHFITAQPLDVASQGFLTKQWSTAGAALLLTVYTLGLIAASLVVFRRRDVT
jgi:ABC-2 type transport system permease protein